MIIVRIILAVIFLFSNQEWLFSGVESAIYRRVRKLQIIRSNYIDIFREQLEEIFDLESSERRKKFKALFQELTDYKNKELWGGLYIARDEIIQIITQADKTREEKGNVLLDMLSVFEKGYFSIFEDHYPEFKFESGIILYDLMFEYMPTKLQSILKNLLSEYSEKKGYKVGSSLVENYLKFVEEKDESKVKGFVKQIKKEKGILKENASILEECAFLKNILGSRREDNREDLELSLTEFLVDVVSFIKGQGGKIDLYSFIEENGKEANCWISAWLLKGLGGLLGLDVGIIDVPLAETFKRGIDVHVANVLNTSDRKFYIIDANQHPYYKVKDPMNPQHKWIRGNVEGETVFLQFPYSTLIYGKDKSEETINGKILSGLNNRQLAAIKIIFDNEREYEELYKTATEIDPYFLASYKRAIKRYCEQADYAYYEEGYEVEAEIYFGNVVRELFWNLYNIVPDKSLLYGIPEEWQP